jgi:dihydroflavonol-4-reductase
LNLIDVRDCALGHILAAEKGRVGEKYILGAENLTLAHILEMLAGICGSPPPKVQIPYALAYSVGAISTAWANLFTHKPPAVSLESVKISRKKMFFSPEKAIRELGLPQSPVKQALSDAVDWFVEHGYASCPRTTK